MMHSGATWQPTSGAPPTWGMSSPGSGANNYEAIFLPAGTTGAISIVVTAFNVGGDGVPNTGDTTDQDFILVSTTVRSSPISP